MPKGKPMLGNLQNVGQPLRRLQRHFPWEQVITMPTKQVELPRNPKYANEVPNE